MNFLSNIPDHTFENIGLKHKIFKPVSQIRKEIEYICLGCEQKPYVCGAYSFHPEYCEKIEGILNNK